MRQLALLIAEELVRNAYHRDPEVGFNIRSDAEIMADVIEDVLNRHGGQLP
jgi:hypothetical protein